MVVRFDIVVSSASSLDYVISNWVIFSSLLAFIFANRTYITPKNTKSKNYFSIDFKWNPIPIELAEKHLETINTLAYHGLNQCWPVPPESGWALAMASLSKVKNKETSFHKKWEGNFNSPGESERAEMRLCFGDDCKSSYFLTNENFKNAYHLLYDPITENLADRI